MKIFLRTVIFFIVVLSSVGMAKKAQKSESKSRFVRYQSWNTKRYPVWKEGDPRYKNSWTGGQVKFNVGNDAPTLTGAKITFTIDILFPANQMALPDGQVIWTKNYIVNGTQRYKGEPVYPSGNSVDEWNAVFPDGSPLSKPGDKKPPYVFVWKTCGKYWQVSDGASSSLTIGTDNISLGSYVMDVVIYHYRKREKFIPIGYASTQFTITDQIPFAVTLTQVNDKDQGDQKFIRNRAVAFNVALHDPSEYLGSSDITFNWDFGDGSGTVISRELTVTHTYTTTGSFKPQVVVQAAIPDPSCATPPNAPTKANPTANSLLSGVAAQSALIITSDSIDWTSTMPPLARKTPPPPPTNGVLHPASSAVPTEQTPQNEEISGADTFKTAISDADVNVVTEEPEWPNVQIQTSDGTTTDLDAVINKETSGAHVVVIEKRQVPDTEQDCVIYRYGSFSTGIEVVDGIESVEIVQVASAFLIAELEQNAVDFTVTCQGSIPTEVCTVVSDADCLSPGKAICNAVSPSPECELVLRHFFNESGVFCINVSVTNEVSLAVTSTRLNVMIGPRFTSIGTVAMVLGILILVLAVGTIAFAYKHLKGYQPLSEVNLVGRPQSAGWSSVPSLFWSLVNQRAPGQKHSGLLHRGV